ncbi:unnamed protein product, partial [Timema podura]|nr:unnamed protein product [Timema podura]
RGSSCSQDEFSRGSVLINIVTDSSHELITGDVNSSNRETRREQDTDSSSEDKQDASTIQLIFRMPDGKLVQLAGRPVEMSDTTPGSVLQVAPAGSTILQQGSEAVSTSGISAMVSNSQSDNSQLSLVKRKLKQTLTDVARVSSSARMPSVTTCESSAVHKPAVVHAPRKLSIPRVSCLKI